MNDDLTRAARIAFRGIRFALEASAVQRADRRSTELYLLVTACGVNGTIAAEVCGCTKQNVSKLVKAVESRRDDQAYDRALAQLERALTGV